MLAYHQPRQETIPTQSLHYQPLVQTSFSPHQSFTSPSPEEISAIFEGVCGLQDQYSMSRATLPIHNPPIRVQKSTPSPGQGQEVASAKTPMLSQSPLNGNTWEGDSLLSPIKFQHSALPRRTGVYHKRASSGSSVTSAGPSSPLDHTTSYPHIANSDSTFSPSAFDTYESYSTPHPAVSKSLPTPVHTPVQSSFLAPVFQNYNPTSQDADHFAAELAMRRAILDHQASAEDDAASFAYSGPHSASSMSHNSPATPQTTYQEDFDDGSKSLPTGEDKFPDVDKWMDEYLQPDAFPEFSTQVPNLNRTISEIYQDELYNPSSGTNLPQQAGRQSFKQAPSLLSPYRQVFADRLQAAHQGHMSAQSQSPAVSMSRERSPFRQGSPFAQSTPSYGGNRSPQSHISSAAQIREQQKAEADAMEMAHHLPEAEEEEAPKTISPKDAVLDYHESAEDLQMPLFPQGQQTPQYGTDASMRRESSNFSTPGPGRIVPQFTNPFIPSQAQMPQQYPFINQQRRQGSSVQSASEHTPEFPAHLTSMESTTSEGTATLPTPTVSSTIKRPDDTSSDSGTYSCTYHGCAQRFETPAKLQKHKREAHRTTPSDQNTGARATGMTSTMNSQSGPHKCQRINPSTGKPCNSIFSRPYDLTRHEDTIHNARKQKVRCHLCTEEKTFSRNDALTRHMRVVHPDVDWPGKTRRKNARE